MISVVCTLISLAAVSGIGLDYGLENTNIVVYDKVSHFSDYNRFRADLSLSHDDFDTFSAKLILDNESRYSEHPDGLNNKGKVYRGYLKYDDGKSRLVLGRQRVPFGVGRLWNPIDVFNPVDSLSFETGERVGTEALRYEYSISDLSGMDLTLSRDKNAFRVKGFLDFADVAAVGVVDNDKDRDILGWEFAGELFSTGVELRSEGGSFHDRDTNERHTEFVGGGEYGFANSLTLLTEYYFNDESKNDHFGWQLSYQPAMLWTCSFLQLVNIDDGSYFIAPSVNYSLSNEMTISAGGFFFSGDAGDEFQLFSDKAYVNYYVHF